MENKPLLKYTLIVFGGNYETDFTVKADSFSAGTGYYYFSRNGNRVGYYPIERTAIIKIEEIEEIEEKTDETDKIQHSIVSV